jgi:hypothetical protein
MYCITFLILIVAIIALIGSHYDIDSETFDDINHANLCEICNVKS